MKNFLEEYGKIVVSVIAIMLIVVAATPVGTALTDGAKTTVAKFTDSMEAGNGSHTQTVRLEGDGQIYYTLAPSELTFRSQEDLSTFKEVKVNGETLDPSNYTLTQGSTVVTLNIDYLKTLDGSKKLYY